MQRKITVSDINQALEKYSNGKNFFQRIMGDSQQIKTLKKFADKIQERRRAESAESKEGFDPLYIEEISELDWIVIRTRLVGIFDDLRTLLDRTEEVSLLRKHYGNRLQDAALFPDAKFKTIENLILMSQNVNFVYLDYIKDIFTLLNKFNLLTSLRYQTVLHLQDQFSYLLDLLNSIVSHCPEDVARTLLEKMDLENVGKYARAILYLPLVFTFKSDETYRTIYIPDVSLLQQVTQHAAFTKEMVAATKLLSSQRNEREIYSKIYSAPKDAVSLVNSIIKIKRISSEDLEELETSKSELIQFLIENSQQCEKISTAICALYGNTYGRGRDAKLYYNSRIVQEIKDYPTLLRPAILQAIKKQPEYATELNEGIQALSAARFTDGLYALPFLTDSNVGLLCAHPQHAVGLAAGLYELRNHSLHSMYASYFEKYPQCALPFSKILVRLSNEIPPNLLTSKNIKEVEKNINHILGIMYLLDKLESISSLNQTMVDLVFLNAKYADKIAKIFDVDALISTRKDIWKNNFLLLCQNTPHLDEIHTELMLIKKSRQKQKIDFLQKDTVANIILFKTFKTGEEAVYPKSNVYKFFGVHKSATQKTMSNHALGDIKVLDIVRSFLTH